MRLVRNRGQKHHWTGACGHRGDRLAQHARGTFGEEVLFVDLDAAVRPFEADLDRQDLRAAVEASTVEAQMLGVSGVPFFVVGDQAMSGAQPLEVFRQVLDDAIAAAQP